MKRIILSLAALFAAFGHAPLRADEGMWLLPLIERINIQQMKQKGLQLEARDIYNPEGLGLKDAVVIFGGGCTGEVVSPSGLVFTNHHCGYNAIQQHSSVEHDYLQDGFWAATLQEELPTPDLSVTFVKEIQDVTAEVLGRVTDRQTQAQRAEAIRRATDRIVKAHTDPKVFRSARVVPMFGGNQYWLFVMERFNDVRMVGAPPSSIGKFGGETDNWMWPRHTGDFSIFRIYASPDNKPANYAPENVPYEAPKFLEISTDGYTEGDYAMILGFPGRTNRYMTSYEIDQFLEQDSPARIFVRGERQKLMWADMLADPKVRIQYANKYAGSSNYWKNSIGMSRGLRRLHIKEQKQAQQESFMAWVAAGDKERQARYEQALPLIRAAVDDRRGAMRTQQYMSETLNTGVESYGLGGRIGAILGAEKKDAVAVGQIRRAGEAFFKNYNPDTDSKITLRMLQIFADSVASADEPDFFAAVRPDIQGYATRLARESILTDTARFWAALDGFDRERWLADPAVVAAESIRKKNKALTDSILTPAAEKFARGHRLWVAGLMEQYPDRVFAPDANFTIRLTYGQVLSYWAADAVRYHYQTTLAGVMAKENPADPEFVVPARLRELYEAEDFGPYVLENGQVPVALLSNNDITGGNSGSGVLDANGRLIGLAFDGNWEAMSSDIAFEPQLQRTISVDIRYVLFILDKYAGAKRLLDELTLVSASF